MRLIRQAKSRFGPRRFVVSFGALAAALATAAVAFAATTGSDVRQSNHAIAAKRSAVHAPGLGVTNAGTPVDGSTLKEPDKRQLELMTAVGKREFGSVFLLVTRGDLAFYRIANVAGPDCYAVGPLQVSDHLFDQIGCVPDFPSVVAPILDMSGGPGHRVIGIASDAVQQIALQDASGTPQGVFRVADNVYSVTAVAKSSAAKLVALNSAGDVLYSLPEPASP